MEKYVIGFWGCYFGTIGLMVAGCVFGFIRSLHQVAANAALTALTSAFFAVTFLGGLPIDDAAILARFQAHVAAATSALLLCLFLSMLGLFRQPRSRRCPLWALAGLTLVTMGAGWLLSPRSALLLGLAQAGVLGLVALGLSLRSLWRRERLAAMAVVGVSFMLVILAGLGSMALSDNGYAPWQLHAISALSGTVYLATTATALWARYAYLIELRQAMKHGPQYDPVTRMRTHAQTGPMVTAVFQRYRKNAVPLGVMVVSIANLHALEKLYGVPAVNHALFVCAGRLLRAVPTQVEVGRLGRDSFLLLMPQCRDSGPLVHLAHVIEASLSRALMLHTSFEHFSLDHEHSRPMHWVAEVGIGVLRVSKADTRASAAVAQARGVSRTAWTYPSRIAWFDEKSGDIAPMPAMAL